MAGAELLMSHIADTLQNLAIRQPIWCFYGLVFKTSCDSNRNTIYNHISGKKDLIAGKSLTHNLFRHSETRGNKYSDLPGCLDTPSERYSLHLGINGIVRESRWVHHNGHIHCFNQRANQ